VTVRADTRSRHTVGARSLPLQIALRYLRSTRRDAFVSSVVGPTGNDDFQVKHSGQCLLADCPLPDIHEVLSLH